MRLQFVAVGKPALAYAKAGVELYTTRLRPYADAVVHYLKPAPLDKLEPRLLDLAGNSFRIVLDERGTKPTTRAFAADLARWRDDPAIKSCTFIIGGSDGHSDAFRRGADHLLALSSLTYQHELALVVLLEQVYRAFTVLHDHPYHRD